MTLDPEDRAIPHFAADLNGIVIEHLQFAHADVGGITLARIADGQSIVATGWEFEFQSSHKIAVLFLGINRAALVRLADHRAVLDLVVVYGASPAREIASVVQRGETR